MNTARLAEYLDAIVDPTFEDFKRTGSARQAFLACVTIFHAVDYAARPKSPASLRQKWRRESMEFSLTDIVAHHFKHVESSDETHAPATGIPIAHVLGFGPTGLDLERRNFYFVMRDAISFLRAKAAGSTPARCHLLTGVPAATLKTKVEATSSEWTTIRSSRPAMSH